MDLSVRIPTKHGEFVMKNPIMPAAATFGNIIEYMKVFDVGLLGALMPNSLGVWDGSPNKVRRVYRGETTFMSAFGPNNISLKSFVDEILPHLPWDRSPVVLDLKARSMEEMAEMASMISEQEAIAALEINLNCPYLMPDVPPYWQDKDSLAELIRRTVDAAGDKAVFVKAPSRDTPLQSVTETIANAGADVFVCYNGIEGCAVDIYTRKYHCGNLGRSSNMGYGLKQHALYNTQVASMASPMPVIGSGGIINAKNVIEHIMVGAYAVQVGSSNLMRPDFMMRLIDELQELMVELGVNCLEEIRGCATQN